MDGTDRRDEIARIVAERRKALGDMQGLDDRVRALSQSGSRHLLPPRPPVIRNPAISVALLGVVAALALIACAATATAVVAGGTWLQSALNDPTTAIQGFYGAVEQRDYTHAYTYFTSDAKAHLSYAAFDDQFASYDTVDGPVISYAIGTPHILGSGDAATVVVAVTRKDAGRTPQSDTLALLKENGQWRINAISITFGKASVAPPSAVS